MTSVKLNDLKLTKLNEFEGLTVFHKGNKYLILRADIRDFYLLPLFSDNLYDILLVKAKFSFINGKHDDIEWKFYDLNDDSECDFEVDVSVPKMDAELMNDLFYNAFDKFVKEGMIGKIFKDCVMKRTVQLVKGGKVDGYNLYKLKFFKFDLNENGSYWDYTVPFGKHDDYPMSPVQAVVNMLRRFELISSD